MKLVYFDTSNLAVLARTRQQDPERFESFAQVWHERGCQLGLSRAHLQEVLRHENGDVRESRYQVFEALTPAMLDLLDEATGRLGVLLGREIAIAVATVLGLNKFLDGLGPRWAGFPTVVSSPLQMAQIRELEAPEVVDFMKQFHDAIRLSSEAQAEASGGRYERTRMRDLGKDPPEAERVEEARRILESEIESGALWGKVTEGLTPDQVERTKALAQDQARDVLDQLSQVGPRRTVEGIVGAPFNERHFVDEALQRAVFARSVKDIVLTLAPGLAPAAVTAVGRLVKIELCPGTWLKNAVEIELLKCKGSPEPNDWFDLDHLSHLPYVDLLVADHEIAANARNVLRRDKVLPDGLRGVRAPVAVAATMDAIKQLIGDI